MKKLFALILALLMLCSCGVQEEPVIEEPQGEAEVSASKNSNEETEKVFPIHTNLTADDEKVKEAVLYVEAIVTNWFASMLDNDPMVVNWEIKSIEFDVDRTNRHISYFFDTGEQDIKKLSENVVAILVKTEINVTEEYHEGYGGFGELRVWHEGNWEPLYRDCFFLSYGEAFYNDNFDEMYRKYAENFETKWKIINYGPY